MLPGFFYQKDKRNNRKRIKEIKEIKKNDIIIIAAKDHTITGGGNDKGK